MTEIMMEERIYQYNIRVFLNEDGDILAEESLGDERWYDTVESRPATEDEMNDYGLWGSDDE